MSAPARPAAIVWLPLGTLTVVAAALALELSPATSRALAFERAAIERGEAWRLFTGHLVHGAGSLAAVDLAAFALFGAWVERVSRRLFWQALAASALVSSLAVLALTAYARYVGSSALASGLLAGAALVLLRSTRTRGPRAIGLTLVALFAAKLVLELLDAWPAALDGLPAGHEPVPAAHLGGALGGAVAAWRWEHGPRPQPPGSPTAPPETR